MTPNRKSQKSRGKKTGSSGSDYKLIIVITGAVILAFLMIYVLIATMPA
jgi:hypothetical protein